ncbi:MAG: methyl-accepting chemotaxis protein [Myxococcota bacterium]
MATKPAIKSKRGQKRGDANHSPGTRDGIRFRIRERLIATVLAASLLPMAGMSAVVAYFSSRESAVFDGMGIAVGSVGLAAFVAGLLVSIILSRSVTRQVEALSFAAHQIRGGNLKARAEILSSDELGMLAQSVNEMLDELGELIQSRDERRNTEESIQRLMAEVTEVASGNLAIEAVVDEGVTGGIADAVNFMVAELRELISNVMQSTTAVSSGAKNISGAAADIANGSEAQAARIVEASTNMTRMAESVREVASRAEALAMRASVAISTAKKGTGAVQNTIQGMGRIREQAQETALRIKRLGEGSQEIGEIVRLIGDIADRTSTLALNASIQSAAAGEAGRGFAVVAEEVERLSVRSAEATRQIDALIRRIQNETKDAVTAVEESTREIVDGSRLANEAGNTLAEIEGVSQELGQLLQGIADQATKQATESEQIVQTMEELSSISSATATQTRGAADDVDQLAGRSDELRESVSTFQLPA